MIARLALRRIFSAVAKRYDGPSISAVFADGSVYPGLPRETNPVQITFKTCRAEWYTLLFFYEGLFESYVNGQVELTGDCPVTALARMGHDLGLAPATFLNNVLRNPLNALRQAVQEWRQSNTDFKRAIANADFHYSLHPALFEHMLGETLGYSEGLWTADTKSLTEAKCNNYEYICRKLRLTPGLQVLEVGPGWGYLPIFMVKRYGVDVTVYNPVRRQNDYMRERFRRHGVADKINLIAGDHRDIARERGHFDRFVSIGVQEHAGYSLRQYQLWAQSIANALKAGGIGVVSTTSFMSRQMTNLLTLKYIFPGGHLPSLPHLLTAFDRAGLTLVEVENLWPHYHRTIDDWRKNFARNWSEIQKADPEVFSERFRRIWTLYLEGTVEVFRDSLDLSHIVFTKGRDPNYYPVPREVNASAELLGETAALEPYR